MGKNSKLNSFCLDTNIIAYFVEGSNEFGELSKNLLKNLRQDRKKVGLSFLTLAELLVKPLVEGEETLIDFYIHLEKLFSIKILYPNSRTAFLAAKLRASYQLPMPDALNLAVAISNSYDVFVTNDEDLQRVKEIKVLPLKDR